MRFETGGRYESIECYKVAQFELINIGFFKKWYLLCNRRGRAIQ